MLLNQGEARSLRRRQQVLGGISAVLVLSFLIAFWPQIQDFFGVLGNLFGIILRSRSLGNWATPQQKFSLLILSFNCLFGFGFVFALWMFLLSFQAILPVQNFVEAYRTGWHLLLYMLRLHGPAVFVRDGQVISTREDQRSGPGVAVVDFNSAIVLESRTPPPGITRGIFNVVHTFLVMTGLADNVESPRAEGPGIVFTRRGEQIRGAVDLRNQFRMQPGVTAYTRDGIEVSARVLSMFTVGQPPEVLQVAYFGEPRPENLRVVTFENVPDNHLRVTGMAPDLEENDRDEIHRFYHAQRVHERLPYNDDHEEHLRNRLPIFDQARVFAAEFSRARGGNERFLPWSELPTRMAASIFREMLSQVNYDQLYNIGSPDPIPLPRFRSQMRLAMRNNGILSYRLVHLRNDGQLQHRRVYARNDLQVSEIRPLVYPKLLRDRGIRVLMASFGDIAPVDENIYTLRLNAWQATWQRDTQITAGLHELEAMRIRNRARAETQLEIIDSLNRILQNRELPEEVLVINLFQTLENLAADPQTTNLLPGGTIDMLRATRELILPNN